QAPPPSLGLESGGPAADRPGERNPCMEGWPSKRIFNHNYEMVTLSAVEFEVLQACDRANFPPEGGTGEISSMTGAELLATTQASLADLTRMQENQLILVYA
ncbi:MAG: SAM-dependent methyltransferase, partial [Nodosilinea sp.]